MLKNATLKKINLPKAFILGLAATRPRLMEVNHCFKNDRTPVLKNQCPGLNRAIADHSYLFAIRSLLIALIFRSRH